MSYGRYTKKSVFAFFAPRKSLFVHNLITVTKYQHCQIANLNEPTLHSVHFLSLSLSHFLSLSPFFLFFSLS
jgi:hypothetical protein